MCICKRLVGCQVAIAGKPAPTIGLGTSGEDWSAVRPPSQASQLPQGSCASARDWSAVRSPSQASQLPQLDWVHPGEIVRLSGRHRRQASPHNWTGYIRGRLVGCQAAIAGKPAPTIGLGTSGRDWSTVRPPSQASQLPQLDWVHPGGIGRLSGRHRSDAATRQASSHKKSEHIRLAFHHSTGRALARLQLLMLTHRPLERPSGGSAQWATRHGCRVSRARPWMADRGGPTEQDRSEGMPSLGEAPNDRGKSALVTFALFESDSL
jgi:hypothetical protein